MSHRHCCPIGATMITFIDHFTSSGLSLLVFLSPSHSKTYFLWTLLFCPSSQPLTERCYSFSLQKGNYRKREVKKIKTTASNLRVKESGGSSKLLSGSINSWRKTNEWRKIPNACGSIGLLHALLNLPERGPDALSPDSKLLQFKAESLPLTGTLFIVRASWKVFDIFPLMQVSKGQSSWTKPPSSLRLTQVPLIQGSLSSPLTLMLTSTSLLLLKVSTRRGECASCIVICALHGWLSCND